MSKAKYQGYEQLESILNEALEQAAAGKGKERHANERAFEDQPMQLISKLLDDNHGLAFQAIKKVQESLRLPDDRAIRELLGAINYIAGMVIFLREAAKNEVPNSDAETLTEDKFKGAVADVRSAAPKPVFIPKQTCPYCGRKHHAWDVCQCIYTNGVVGNSEPLWIRPGVISTLNSTHAIDCKAGSGIKATLATQTDALTDRKDTVPLKQYNDLLAQYTELEKRLLEHN